MTFKIWFHVARNEAQPQVEEIVEGEWNWNWSRIRCVEYRWHRRWFALLVSLTYYITIIVYIFGREGLLLTVLLNSSTSILQFTLVLLIKNLFDLPTQPYPFSLITVRTQAASISWIVTFSCYQRSIALYCIDLWVSVNTYVCMHVQVVMVKATGIIVPMYILFQITAIINICINHQSTPCPR